MIVLANDGISEKGIQLLKEADITVLDARVSAEHLSNFINENNVDVLLVRSATQVRKNLIDECPNLKIIGRGGIGMDNIDVDYSCIGSRCDRDANDRYNSILYIDK